MEKSEDNISDRNYMWIFVVIALLWLFILAWGSGVFGNKTKEELEQIEHDKLQKEIWKSVLEKSKDPN